MSTNDLTVGAVVSNIIKVLYEPDIYVFYQGCRHMYRRLCYWNYSFVWKVLLPDSLGVHLIKLSYSL